MNLLTCQCGHDYLSHLSRKSKLVRPEPDPVVCAKCPCEQWKPPVVDEGTK